VWEEIVTGQDKKKTRSQMPRLRRQPIRKGLGM
jgi:hypothetical protein